LDVKRKKEVTSLGYYAIHNEEFRNVYGSPTVVRVVAPRKRVARIQETRNSIKTNNREMRYEDGRWMELARGRVQRWTLVLAALNLRIHLPQC
jgi:hypothetical protein